MFGMSFGLAAAFFALVGGDEKAEFSRGGCYQIPRLLFFRKEMLRQKQGVASAPGGAAK